jgi:hypothetical protein
MLIKISKLSPQKIKEKSSSHYRFLPTSPATQAVQEVQDFRAYLSDLAYQDNPWVPVAQACPVHLWAPEFLQLRRVQGDRDLPLGPQDLESIFINQFRPKFTDKT